MEIEAMPLTDEKETNNKIIQKTSKDVSQPQKRKLLRLQRQQRLDEAAIPRTASNKKDSKSRRIGRKQYKNVGYVLGEQSSTISKSNLVNSNNNESKTATGRTTRSSAAVRAVAVDTLSVESYDSDDFEKSSYEIKAPSSSCYSEEQLPMARPVDLDALKANYKIPSRASVEQKIKSEIAIADEIVENNNYKVVRCTSNFGTLVSTATFMVITAIIVGVVLSTAQQQRMDKQEFAPTASPTLSSFIILQDHMKSISGDAVFDDSSPQYKALQWLTYEDSFKFDSDDELHYRYILAIVYFSTGGPNWLKDLNFFTNSSVCSWNDNYNNNNILGKNRLSGGVHCDDRGVTTIILDHNNLNGTIPFEIGMTLKYIDKISISGNNIYGTIPSSLGNLFRLEYLEVSFNALSGTIPTSFTHLTKLEYFSTRYNHLTGPIPSAITNLESLERLDLSVNELTGSIPEFSLRNSLEYLSLLNNLLDGPLPESLVRLSHLEVLNLSMNFLSGTLPSSLGMLENLSILFLFQNVIAGSLPVSIGNLDLLTTLALDSNAFTGTILSEIGQLTKLQQIYLNHNNLSGTIPTEFGQCTDLYWIYLESNPEISGTIPHTFSNFYWLESLHLQNTSITGSLDTLICSLQTVAAADCGGLSPNVNCTCCTECCDPISGICKEDNDKICAGIEYRAATIYGHSADCSCMGSDTGFTCNMEDCPSCNEDGTICGAVQQLGYNQPASFFSTTYHNLFKYTIGRNETIMWTETPEVGCNISINGEQCNTCSVYYCYDGFPARHIDCTNIVDIKSGGVYDTCQHYENGGIFEYISWWDTFSWTGCLPFYYRSLQ